MRRPWFIGVLALGTTFPAFSFGAAPAYPTAPTESQTRAAKPLHVHVNGRVESFSPLVVRQPDGRILKIDLDPKAAIYREIHPEEIRPGEHVLALVKRDVQGAELEPRRLLVGSENFFQFMEGLGKWARINLDQIEGDVISIQPLTVRVQYGKDVTLRVAGDSAVLHVSKLLSTDKDVEVALSGIQGGGDRVVAKVIFLGWGADRILPVGPHPVP